MGRWGQGKGEEASGGNAGIGLVGNCRGSGEGADGNGDVWEGAKW